MKKTTRTFKKFAAITSASLLVACMVAPAMSSFNASADDTYSITITGFSGTYEKEFKAYQVFTGTLDDNVLGDLKWGDGITAYSGASNVVDGNAVDASIISGLGNDAVTIAGNCTFNDSNAIIKTSTETSVVFGNLEPGYYIIKDVSNLSGKNDANSTWIVQVSKNQEVVVKNAFPTVDKKIWDETDDAEEGTSDGWGESADHAINESFQFKLTATIPADADLASYGKYKLVFNDDLSDGVTFDGIESVIVSYGNSTKKIDEKTSENTNGYETSAISSNQAGLNWTLTIYDLIKHLPEGATLSSGLKVDVIYNAHLNENAIVHNVSNSDNGQLYSDGGNVYVNNNKVFLQYSNNPNVSGEGSTLGKTEEDTVGVFTYNVLNTKYITGTETPLEGVGFRLYSDSYCLTEVPLVLSTNGYYIPAGSGTPAEMFSKSNGTFNINGLDVGTYYLKETTTPAGYNTITEPITIVISAEHSEVADGTSAKLVLNKAESPSSNMNNNIYNSKGSSLPSTGGIGTTIFYLGGGAMAAIGGVYLISKKRMKNNQE